MGVETLPPFNASLGWVQAFFQRHDLKPKKYKGEQLSASIAAAETYQAIIERSSRKEVVHWTKFFTPMKQQCTEIWCQEARALHLKGDKKKSRVINPSRPHHPSAWLKCFRFLQTQAPSTSHGTKYMCLQCKNISNGAYFDND